MKDWTMLLQKLSRLASKFAYRGLPFATNVRPNALERFARRGAGHHCAMQGISRAIDRAIDLGLIEHADRLAEKALGMWDLTPQLIERLARLKLVQGQPKVALRIIDRCRDKTASLRLLRVTCRLLVGQRLDAHLELQQWSSQNTCPLEARCLLALLNAELGEKDDAERELLKNTRQLDDPMSFMLLLLMSVGRERHDLAAGWATRLLSTVQSRAATPSPQFLAESLEIAARASLSFADHDVETLAVELTSCEPVLPTLVAAQEIEPEQPVARLLYRAVEQALPEMTSRDAAIESLIRLALVLDERDLAKQWIETAIEENRITALITRLAWDCQPSALGLDIQPPADGRSLRADGRQPTADSPCWRRAA